MNNQHSGLVVFFVVMLAVLITIWFIRFIGDACDNIERDYIKPVINSIFPPAHFASVEIRIGVTTREILIQALGPPTTFSADLTGETLTWTYKKKSNITITVQNPPAAPIRLFKQQLAVVLINNVVVSIAS
jgi:hypothetical protein